MMRGQIANSFCPVNFGAIFGCAVEGRSAHSGLQSRSAYSFSTSIASEWRLAARTRSRPESLHSR